MADSFFK